jgi:hypothetical protein
MESKPTAKQGKKPSEQKAEHFDHFNNKQDMFCSKIEQGVSVEELKNLKMIYKTAQQERKDKVQDMDELISDPPEHQLRLQLHKDSVAK